MSKMRRSHSISNIPLPKSNLFGIRNTEACKNVASKRSRSVTRLSQRDSVASAVKIGSKLSLERKSNNPTSLLRVTPLTKYNRPGSLQRTTPNSAISQRTSSRGTTPVSCRIERKTIQKLATDKKWVADQYIKVQNFIATSGLFDAAIVGAKINPPSINIFCTITGILLLEIFPKIKITTANYKEVIPAHLKILHYPGTLTNSVLKTVNTKNSLPQVVGMWSWLIDKVKLSMFTINESFVNNLEPEQQRHFLLKENNLDFFTKRYAVFNNDENCEEKVEEANDFFVKNSARILNVDMESAKELETDVTEKKEYRNRQAQEVEPLKEEKQRLEAKIEQMNKEIEEFQIDDPIIESELNGKLQLLQINIQDLRSSKLKTKENIAQLEELIKSQRCTYPEKLSLLNQIKELRSEINVKKGKIEHALQIKNKFDLKLSSELTKIQSLVIEKNRALMELSIKKPEFKKLLLREKGFHDPYFLIESKEVVGKMLEIEKEVESSLVKVEDEIRAQERRKREVEGEIEELNRVVDGMHEEIVKVTENIDRIKMEIRELELSSEQRLKLHNEQLKELQTKAALEGKTEIIDMLRKKRDHQDVEVKKFGGKMLGFFVEMQNQVVNNIKEMDAIKRDVSKKFVNKVLRTVERPTDVLDAWNAFIKENKE